MRKPLEVTLIVMAWLLCNHPTPVATDSQIKALRHNHRLYRSPHENTPLTTSDPHGGVPMGISNSLCDDAETYLEVDWDPASKQEYTCDSESALKPPLHQCLPDPIVYSEAIPTSGAHRPLWPRYGEYDYVPPQRWLHSLEHGGIVFLYHPCADAKQVEQLREIAKGCLYKHIITPNKNLSLDTPYAALAWGCKLLMSSVVPSRVVTFIKEHALKGHEGHVNADGQYSKALRVPATHQLYEEDTEASLCHMLTSEGNNNQDSLAVHGEDGKTFSSTGETKSSSDRYFSSVSDIVNRIAADSARRRSRLDEESAKLNRNIQKLITAFRKFQQ
ncbi:hypothetical protein C0Q70_06678 [Pomacea canaliculata]|uniref:DUF3105 domain-containing protein n=1 Tax=Pomacea canaliculata TaxID=400727 RepID=A0A2T7PCW3_POMCA|nr:hypothetical protein C0Q70_06678 [Pomacea canaliculata]